MFYGMGEAVGHKTTRRGRAGKRDLGNKVRN